MPLIKSGSKKAREENVKEMIEAGHPSNQAVAASYANQRKYRSERDKERHEHEDRKYGHGLR
jgi:ribosomal protein L12E/L44/L45/RPP1/RPP2